MPKSIIKKLVKTAVKHPAPTFIIVAGVIFGTDTYLHSKDKNKEDNLNTTATAVEEPVKAQIANSFSRNLIP